MASKKGVHFHPTVVEDVIPTAPPVAEDASETMGNSKSRQRKSSAPPPLDAATSSEAVVPSTSTTHEISVQPHKASSSLDTKLIDALKELKRRKDHDGGDKHDPFTKILLKGPTLKEAFDSVRVTFHEFDRHQKGFIDFGDMEDALNRLGGNFTKAEIDEAFSEADMTENGRLSFKEFLVCLAIGFVLHRIPALESHEKQLSIFYAPLSGSEPKTLLFGEGNKLRQAFQLAIDVFLWFDIDGDGLIEKSEMLSRLHESMHEHSPTKKMSKSRATKLSGAGASCPANTFISQKRFNEMDWDHDGSITFKEFLMAFESWVGVEEDDDDGGDDEDMDQT